MTMAYKYKPGFGVKGVPADVAGEELNRLSTLNGDALTPSLVVEESRPEEAPLHPAFEWDDEAAAEKYREDQARRLIRNVYVVDDSRPDSRPMLHHVHVTLPEIGPCYVTTARALTDDELRQQVEADALKAFEALRERYRHIMALAPIFAAIEAVQARKARNRRPAIVEARP